MLQTTEYQREKAVAYAVEWAYRRNPRYLDFQGLGGDCTNFVSQCIYHANYIMNFTPVYGWYYLSSDNRTASWTGVSYFYRFLTANQGPGPFASETAAESIQPGDVIQLGDDNGKFYHTLLVTDTGEIPDNSNIFIAAHTDDSLHRPLNTYQFSNIRYLHIEGVRYQS